MTITHLSQLADSSLCPCLVIKVGSALLVGADGVRRDWIDALVDEIADARGRGQQVIVVSSGAIALGAATLGLDKGGRGSLADAQAAAAVGQIALSGLWSQLLVSHGLTAAQMLLTLEDLEDRRRYLNVTATLSRLLDCGAVPVINENDLVATQEIRFGDNDRLAARVAQAAGASAVVLLSDIDGLFDRHPRLPGAALIPVVEGVTDAVRAMASAESNSGMGSGGMVSKLQAADIAELAGIALVIGNGQPLHPLSRIFGTRVGAGAAAPVGTLFRPRRSAGARKAWLGGRMRMKGSLVVDDGAARALSEGASLLAKGVIAVDGLFGRGDPVAIRDAGGRVLAQGLCEYDASECERIRGLHSNAQGAVLGYAPRSAVVHRDQMVMK